MTVTAWPNGLGWDVADATESDAEIWRLDGGLLVYVLAGNEMKALYIPDPLVHPVDAVRCCREDGTPISDYEMERE